MEPETQKCVIVADPTFPVGLVANTAAILGMTLGKRIPEMVGPDVVDTTGNVHPGIILFPIPILKATSEQIKALRETAYTSEYSSTLTVVDFSNVAQQCKDYGDYTRQMAQTPTEQLAYLGIAIYGPKKQVNHLTGSLPLLR